MSTAKYKCVIFDLDGTLLYTLVSINNAINEALQLCGYPTHSLENTVNLVNFGSVELVRRALPEEKRTEDEIMRVHEIYHPILKKHSDDGIKPYDGIIEVCRQLKKSGIKLCVMSNKPQSSAESCINTYFDEEIFDVVRGFVPEKYVKPDAKFTHSVIEEAGVSINDCILVGDSIVDLETAKNAGCKIIWVKWGYGNENNIGGKPDYVAEHPSEIAKIVLG